MAYIGNFKDTNVMTKQTSFKNPSCPMILHLLHNSIETKNLVLIISLSKGKLILQNMAEV
jgi:hypothetical protein